MEHFDRDYTLGDISQSLINPSYSVLRNLLLFSFKKVVDNNYTTEKPDPRVMTDLLIYFMSVEQEQIFKNSDKISEHGGYFVRNCNQIEKENFITYKVRTKCMKELENLGLIKTTRLGNLNGVLSILVNDEGIKDFLNQNSFDFELYHRDLNEEEVKKSEIRKTTYENHMEELKDKTSKEQEVIWSNINQLKYKPLVELQMYLSSLGKYYDHTDSILISLISKGYWKYQHKVINWTEKDLNLIRRVVCGDRLIGRTREQQSEYYVRKGNDQRIIDSCKKTNSPMNNRNWSFNYGYVYEKIVIVGNNYHEGNSYLSQEDTDYFIKQDLTENVYQGIYN